MVSFEKTKFRASSWGNLLTESKVKGEAIGKTCQMELIKIYNQEVYGRKKEILTAAMDKGKLCEPEGISLYSMLEGKLYSKNDELLENEFFKGHPDLILDGECSDIKCSWELDSFMPKVIEEPDKGYVAQLNVYYSLTDCQYGNLVYCLIDCPPGILEAEKRKLLYSMDVATEFNPEYVKAAEHLEYLLTFPDIPPEQRCIKIKIDRDEELIQKMKAKVPVMRQWLEDFHKKHMNLYSQQVV